MWNEVVNRQLGRSRPSAFASRVRASRLSSIKLSNNKEIVSLHKGGVNTLQVDLTEGRYLLSGASDGSAAVYDIQQATSCDSNAVAKHRPLFLVDKNVQCGHSYAISSAVWYPVDTGLFVTGSYDQYVKVWDTNMTQVEMSFKMPGKVYGIAMSSVATSHMLIATGTEDVQVRLCDIASGAFTHTLSGHRAGVFSVQWSTSNEWVLMTGGCDGAIRFWDIRRAGCFRVLDQFQTQLGRRPAISGSKSAKLSGFQPSDSGYSVTARLPQKRITVANGTKQSCSLYKGQPKGSVIQRLHPGMSSTHNRATAHFGAVTGLKITEDGMYLLSAGTDSRLRLWDIESGCNTLVNYDALRFQSKKNVQLAVASDLSLVFVPCTTSVKAYDIWSGKTFSTFHGHYESVNCCCFSSADQELYTGSNDRQILLWSPSVSTAADEGSESLTDHDNWSD
ncbi:WD repeat-containing protein ATCSA-1 [Nymphaea colorata]|nr:WD repeat-containing protein ATCSA-1 [Nymphaea colorata]